MWARQRAWLPPTTIAPTLYGRGDSVEAWASSVLAEAVGSSIVAVGASVGGFCALEMARQAPDRVRCIVLVGSKTGVRRDVDARDEALRTLGNEGFDAAW